MEDKKKSIERVKVTVRARPLTSEDIKFSGKDTIIEEINTELSNISIKKDSDRKAFGFDSVFDENSTQKNVYLKVGKPVIESVLSGYNSTILAYGQTGTGKTYTMVGSGGKHKGIIPRCVKEVFKVIASDYEHAYFVKVGYMQLYMEVLQDLIKPNNNSPVIVREDADEGVFFAGLNWMDVESVEECMGFLATGDKNRSIAFTNMNSQSSRSHAVFMVKVERRLKPKPTSESPAKKDSTNRTMTKSTLYLVDLAGSERVSKTKTSGSRLDEAKNINLSLLALGNVIQALSDGKSKFIPFRDSKLTRILEQSLGGNSKTSMIVTIGPSPSNFQESLSSLLFAARAMKIQNIPKMNLTIDYKAMYSKLQGEIDKINDSKNISNIEYDKIVEENNLLKERLEKTTMDRDKLMIVVETSRNGVDNSMLLSDSEECLKLKAYYRKKLEGKDEEFRKYSQRMDILMTEKDEALMGLETKVQELESIVFSLSAEYKKLEKELVKEREDKERLIFEIYDLREMPNFDKDNFNQEIMRIVGKSNSSSVKSSSSSILLSSKIKSPIMSPRVVHRENFTKKHTHTRFVDDEENTHECSKCEKLLEEIKKDEQIIDSLENALIDMTEKFHNEHSNHRDTVIMYEKDKRELKKGMAKLIKAYKNLEKKALYEMNSN